MTLIDILIAVSLATVVTYLVNRWVRSLVGVDDYYPQILFCF